MLNITMDINGKVVSKIEIQNLRTSATGMAHYRVDAKIDEVPVTAFFKHQRGDGLAVCTMRAMEAIVDKSDARVTPIKQTYEDPGRI